ncbi:MAG: hypothetical protein QOD99_986 [Chthoniobacter sp.]|jgi:hypothetical protein|nr:hypothetical protein [Chthoniobacter sp.]
MFKRAQVTRLRVCLAILLFGNFAIADDKTTPQKAAKSSWKITGQLEEACSCDAACPCWFGSKPTQMACGGAQVLFIEKGSYGDVPLDGLAVANFAQSPDGQAMMDSFGNWNFSYGYIDERSTPAQRNALREIAKVALPEAASKKVEYRFVPITRKTDGDKHEITIGDLGKFRGYLIEGGLGGAAKITNPPAADPIHHEYAQGKTDSLVYRDAGQSWDFKNSNYMRGTFTVDSEQYEKFTAGLAQKMAGKNK